jgi:hypothetical protein
MTSRMLLLIALAIALTAAAFNVLFAQDPELVTICHHPPGNPEQAQTITVASPSVPAHLAHGDSVGACGGSPIN